MLSHLIVARAQLRPRVDLNAYGTFTCWLSAFRRRIGV